MGCAVNGPGEAADADVGIAGGDRRGELLVFEHGKPLAKLPESEAFAFLQKKILDSVRE